MHSLRNLLDPDELEAEVADALEDPVELRLIEGADESRLTAGGLDRDAVEGRGESLAQPSAQDDSKGPRRHDAAESRTGRGDLSITPGANHPGDFRMLSRLDGRDARPAGNGSAEEEQT